MFSKNRKLRKKWKTFEHFHFANGIEKELRPSRQLKFLLHFPIALSTASALQPPHPCLIMRKGFVRHGEGAEDDSMVLRNFCNSKTEFDLRFHSELEEWLFLLKALGGMLSDMLLLRFKDSSISFSIVHQVQASALSHRELSCFARESNKVSLSWFRYLEIQ